MLRHRSPNSSYRSQQEFIQQDPKGEAKLVSPYKTSSKSEAPPLESASKKRKLIIKALVDLKKSKVYLLRHFLDL